MKNIEKIANEIIKELDNEASSEEQQNDLAYGKMNEHPQSNLDFIK